jgi:hypothetical protein
MGWFERLSGSDQPEGARNASVAERIEISRYLAHHQPLRSDESFQWDGNLFTGYHLHRARSGASTEYIKLDGTSSSKTSNDSNG